MKYEKLYRDFIELFPDDKDYFERIRLENDVEENEGMHIMFGFVVLPFIKKIVRESEEKSKTAFDFFEKMEKSGDSKIAEVVEFTILEDLISNERESFELYSVYFGDETKLAVQAIAKWYRQ